MAVPPAHRPPHLAWYARCTRAGMELAESPSRLQDRWATIHDLQGKYQLAQELRILRAAAERWAPEGIRTLLDVGCGDGRRALALSRAFPEARVIGVEIREALAEEARAVCSGAPIEIRCEDFCRPGPLHKGEFDLVHVRFALHLLDASPPAPDKPASPAAGEAAASSRDDFLHHLALACRPGGIVFAEDHDTGLQLVHPPCPFLDRMRESAARLRQRAGLDVEIGRKLPALLSAHGFADLHIELSCLDSLSMGPDFLALLTAQAEVLSATVPDDLSPEEVRQGLMELALWQSAGGALSLGAACVVTGRREAVIP